MIKRIKKISSLIIALVFMLTLTIGSKSIHASKVEQGSITIFDSQKDKEYRLYKIFNLTHKSGNVNYSISKNWEEFFENGEGEDYIVDYYEDDLNPILVGGEIKYINITEDNVDKFAMAAFRFAASMAPDIMETGTGNDLEIEVGELGYYLVYPKGASEILDGQASIVSLTSTVPDGYVEIKSTYPDIKKEADKITADIGEPIEYTLTGKVPDTTGYKTYQYKISDKLSKGLSLDEKSIEIFIDDRKIDDSSPFILIRSALDNEIVLTFDMLKLQDYVGDEIMVKYKASLNGDAVIGKDGNENTVTLEYSNDPKKSELTDKTPPVVVKVYTAKIKILKIDGSYESPLKGAKFVLKDQDGSYFHYDYDRSNVEWVDKIDEADEMETKEDGIIEFTGLKAGTYYLEETEAPEGYNILTKDVEIEVTENDAKTIGIINVTVENNSGTVLPDTGGRGKILFITMGGAVIMIALFSIVKDRLKKERN